MPQDWPTDGTEPGAGAPEITDFNYMGSALGNAFFSGVSMKQLWSCVSLSETPAEFDEAVSATIKLNEITNE